MKKKKYLIPELSAFFPCHNEEENVDKTINDAAKILKEITPKWQIVAVNDGSTDQTGPKLNALKKKYPQLKVIHHKKNKGYGGSFKSGLYGSECKWITFNDADGQFDFSEIKKLIKAQKKENVDVVLGYRIKRKDKPIRVVIATLLKVWNFIFFGFRGVKDVDCAFKLFKKEVIDKIGKLKTDSAITSTELLIKIQRAGYTWTQVGVHHYPRAAGTQSGADFKVMSRAAKDSLNLLKALR